MNAEIISIGSELLLGQLVDTNTSSIAKKLAEIGVELVRTETVGDYLHRIKEVMNEAIARSHIVITTGGIGPTEDDLTREAVAGVFNRPLHFHPLLMEQIELLFKKRGFRMAENNRKQAFIPEGGIPIENPMGTAPGFIVEYPGGAIISIPGVPLEMEYLMDHAVIPYLRKHFDLREQIIRYKVLRACGLGESAIGLQIKDLMKESVNPSVGTLASIGDIRIRITARAEDPARASSLIEKMESEIRGRLGSLIYGVDDETLHGNVAKDLERLNLTLSLLETFSAGIITQKLASTGTRSLVRGLVLPSDQSLSTDLRISDDEVLDLQKDPESLAGRLAAKAREETKANLGMAVHGVIGEEQGRGDYRVDTFCALSGDEGMESQAHFLGGELWMVRERASIIGLDMLRKYLLKIRSAGSPPSS
jgi:nicotinamide-nucleotide amidase